MSRTLLQHNNKGKKKMLCQWKNIIIIIATDHTQQSKEVKYNNGAEPGMATQQMSGLLSYKQGEHYVIFFALLKQVFHRDNQWCEPWTGTELKEPPDVGEISAQKLSNSERNVPFYYLQLSDSFSHFIINHCHWSLFVLSSQIINTENWHILREISTNQHCHKSGVVVCFTFPLNKINKGGTYWSKEEAKCKKMSERQNEKITTLDEFNDEKVCRRQTITYSV